MDVAARLSLRLDDVVTLFCHVLDEHFLKCDISYSKKWMGRLKCTVAKVMTNEALFEHMLISVSRPTIFLTLDTVPISI